MSRKRTIALGGLALIAALALFDRHRGRSVTLPATVTAIEEEIPDAGPNLWRIDVLTRDGTAHTLDRRSARPTLNPGDAVCIDVFMRRFAREKSILSAATDCGS
ncbi:hypothetical protein KDD17_07580 [Sulfitobacter albidus]|uniref:Uncharacterized protein n=1 Tax=Sulfitobacter albidus TaxID=2829501 RepID=A0A975JFX1_9RHOB|nr:hypothetical protein [Sulfitobacter albidus]QUJ77791.1 hypothetical protein KDD17_07580 [Sulfitobacter albidus]